MASASPETRLFFRDLALLLGLPFGLLVVLVYWWHPWPEKYDAPAGQTVFDEAAGTWGWAGRDTCGVDHHTILFDSTFAVMRIVHAKPWREATGLWVDTTVYDISEASAHHVRGLIRGEDRTTPIGTTVVWDLVMTGQDSYQWKQAGFWGILGYSGVITRCPPTSEWPYAIPN